MDNNRRRTLGLLKVREVPRPQPPDASRGGSRGYGVEHRRDMLARHVNES